MALISLSEWIDRFGDEPEDDAVAEMPRLTFRVEPEPRDGGHADRPFHMLRPIGCEIAGTRTRLV
jgi:hypothetical protein